MDWYVIRTKPRQEKMAEFHLRQLAIETYLPLLRHRKRVRRDDEMVVEPLFPRYLFARFNIDDRYRAVNFARGVMNVVQFGIRPAEVSESLIEAIRGRSEDGYVTLKTVQFQQGQIVRINDGPLAGLEAVFLREMTEQNRVLLLLKTLGIHAKLTMDSDQISLPQAL